MHYLAIKPALGPELHIDVSAEQAALMLRAIGGDTTPYRKYRDNKYYYASQNHADKGPDDVLWKDLVKKGAVKRIGDSYVVSTYGLYVLERFTDSTIYAYYDAPEWLVLALLAQHELYDGQCREFPVAITSLARNLNMNVRQVTRIIHKHVADGYVEKYCYQGAHGWRVTDKVRNHPEYQKRLAERIAFDAKIKEDMKADMRKDMPNVKTLDVLGVYLENIYGDLPAPHAMYFPEDIRELGLTDEKIRELFPDKEEMKPGTWSSYGYKHRKLEIGLYLEPEDNRLQDWYGPYTLQIFFADDDIVCLAAR